VEGASVATLRASVCRGSAMSAAREASTAREGNAAREASTARGVIVSADWVISDAAAEARPGHGVRVVEGLIDSVAPTAELRARHRSDGFVDGGGCAMIPGFVNAHVHLYGVLAHGVPAPAAPVADFWGFLDDYWWPLVENALDREMIAAAADWGTAELAAGGTTSFFDILEAPNALPDALAVEAEAVRRRGLRAVLSFEATERMGAANGRAGLAENVRFIEQCRADADAAAQAGAAAGVPAGRTSGAMCFHTAFTCSEPFILQAFELAEEHGVFCHAHVNESVHEGRWCEERLGLRTLEFYNRIGVASPRFQASQCVQLSQREIDIIVEAGIRVSHMPLSNCEVGGGIAPVPELLARGVTVGLGSDGYINDMFAVMRGAFLLHRAATLDPGAVSAAEVLHLATEGAARTLGLKRVGRLEPGWHADLVLVDVSGRDGLPTPVTAHNLAEQLVLWRSRAHVRRVMAGGKWLVQDGEVIGADWAELRARCREQAARLWS